MAVTDCAVVTLQADGTPLKGVVGVLALSTLPAAIPFITNKDGYVLVSGVPFPFTGTVQVGGAAVAFDQPLPISVTAVNTTLRFGGGPMNPQDIVLPAVEASFKLPPPAPRDWRGAFVIPDALPGIPLGDGRRIWTPAFGAYRGTDWQDRILEAFVERGYRDFPINVAGSLYHDDYGDLPDDPVAARKDLIKIIRAGCLPVVCACDDQAPSVVPWRSFTENADLIRRAFPMWEMNGPLSMPTYHPEDGSFSGPMVDCITNTLAAAPRADVFLHFTAGHGSIGIPESAGWSFCAALGVKGLMSQDDGFERNPATGDPAGTAAGLQDTAQRLATHGLVNVAFEQTTTPVYHDWPGWDETHQRDYGVYLVQHAPGIVGYCDGGRS